MQTQTTVGLSTYLQTDFETALEQVTNALKSEGFGILTEIDVKATLKQKLDVDFRPYKILGACNPSLAHRALNAAHDVGLLLPCNVTVAMMDDKRIQVAIVDPLLMMTVIPNEGLTSVAQEARERLNRVLQQLQE